MIKIACVIHSLGIGGMERVMSLLVNDFARRSNVEVHLILIGKNRNIEFDLDERVYIYRPNFKFNPRTRLWCTFKTIMFIRFTINKIQPSSILSFGEIWNNLVLLSLMRTKHSIYISDRSQPNKDLGRTHNFLRNWLYPKASGLIAQTSIAREIAIKNKWNRHITVIGNPIQNLKLPKIPKEKIVLTVGRLISTKNIDQLIHIFKKIDNPEWQLIIIGGNAKNLDLLTKYRNLVTQLQLQNRVLLLGEQKSILKYLAKSSIFAFASTSEGFPNALAEAVAAQLPVVAYDCIAGPSDLIKHGMNGYLIEIKNETLFQQYLENLMDSEELRNKFASNSLEIIEKYNLDLIAQKYFETLTQNHENSY